MENLLRHKLYHRARKIIIRPESKKKIDQDGESSAVEDPTEKKNGKKVADKEETPEAKEDGTEKKVVEKKEKKKVKLDMHLEQIYEDGNEVYLRTIDAMFCSNMISNWSYFLVKRYTCGFTIPFQ